MSKEYVFKAQSHKVVILVVANLKIQRKGFLRRDYSLPEVIFI